MPRTHSHSLTLRTASIAICVLASSTPASIVVLSSGGTATSNGSFIILGQPIIGRASHSAVQADLGFLPCALAGCPADFDGSGFVDTDDFTAFVVDFEKGVPQADFDGTGFVDLDDYVYFLQRFIEGC